MNKPILDAYGKINHLIGLWSTKPTTIENKKLIDFLSDISSLLNKGISTGINSKNLDYTQTDDVSLTIDELQLGVYYTLKIETFNTHNIENWNVQFINVQDKELYEFRSFSNKIQHSFYRKDGFLYFQDYGKVISIKRL
jgi:hypothetical protein